MSQFTFRYQFTNDFTNNMYKFSKLTTNLDKDEFDSKFEDFCNKNKDAVEFEAFGLRQSGFEGDIKEKMYKSIRYYLKNKEETKPKKRRKYITIDKDILNEMDCHIESIICKSPTKPATCYDAFVNDEKFTEMISNCKDSVMQKSENISEDDFNLKIKKTYKNRYFLIQRKMKEELENEEGEEEVEEENGK